MSPIRGYFIELWVKYSYWVLLWRRMRKLYPPPTTWSWVTQLWSLAFMTRPWVSSLTTCTLRIILDLESAVNLEIFISFKVSVMSDLVSKLNNFWEVTQISRSMPSHEDQTSRLGEPQGQWWEVVVTLIISLPMSIGYFNILEVGPSHCWNVKIPS